MDTFTEAISIGEMGTTLMKNACKYDNQHAMTCIIMQANQAVEMVMCFLFWKKEGKITARLC